MVWIARDCDGSLRAFEEEPVWDTEFEEDWQGKMICFVSDTFKEYEDLPCCEKRHVDKDFKLDKPYRSSTE